MDIADGSSNTWVLVVAGILQTVYYTALVGFAGARILSRIAVMEFKVDDLWHRDRGTDENK